MDFSIIRNSLLSEAIQSPNLLSDLAGLESYISESYNNRSFIELLQNADDACSSMFLVERFGDYLIVANDGRPFNSTDIESICRSAASQKERGTTIGYRGIGFKSVVNIASEIHIISGDYKITFSRQLTHKAVPQASKVPLVRIPHPLVSEVESQIYNKIENLKLSGYSTFFIFSDLINRAIEDEFSQFNFNALIFLKHICRVDINIRDRKTASLTRLADSIKLNIGNESTEWMIYSQNNVSLAFSMKDGEIVRLSYDAALIHSFLPTEDHSETGIVFNGDFSTDPSRRHLIFDAETLKTLDSIGELYVHILCNNILSKGRESKEIISAMIPYCDFRMSQFSNNLFIKEFSNSVSKYAKGRFEQFYIAPVWINAEDFCSVVGKKAVPANISKIEGLIPFVKFFNIKEIDIQEFISDYDVSNATLSLNGCVQIMAEIIRYAALGNEIKHLDDLNVLYQDDERMSLKSLKDKGICISPAYLSLLSEQGLSQSDIEHFFRKLGLIERLPKLDVPTENTTPDNSIEESNQKPVAGISNWLLNETTKTEIVTSDGSQYKWRRSEEKALLFFNQNGFSLKDVSRQNLGYDLSGTDPNGEQIYLEVKSVNHRGESFRMTNNEYAVAQLYGDKYFIVIVFQADDTVEFGLLQNPVANLDFERTVVQWVWNCNAYNYKPIVAH